MSKRKNENELEEHEKPSTKRQRFKSGPANQKFLPLYHELWPCLERSDKGDTYAKCTVCNAHFCCAHSGRYDCKRHIESKQHKDFIKLKQSSRSIANYCVENQTKTNLDMQIVKAEAITCEIITDNNLSLSTANPLSRSFKVMFPDSKIAAGMFTSFSFLNTCSNILSQDY